MSKSSTSQEESHKCILPVLESTSYIVVPADDWQKPGGVNQYPYMIQPTLRHKYQKNIGSLTIAIECN